MKEKVRQITSRTGGRSISSVVAELRGYLIGWKEYFKLADTPTIFRRLDEWIRRRLRMLHLRQWKCGWTAFDALRARGLSRQNAAIAAAQVRQWWRTSNHRTVDIALPNTYFDALGVPRIAA